MTRTQRTAEPRYGVRPDGTRYINPLYVWPVVPDPREPEWTQPGAACLMKPYYLDYYAAPITAEGMSR